MGVFYHSFIATDVRTYTYAVNFSRIDDLFSLTILAIYWRPPLALLPGWNFAQTVTKCLGAHLSIKQQFLKVSSENIMDQVC